MGEIWGRIVAPRVCTRGVVILAVITGLVGAALPGAAVAAAPARASAPARLSQVVTDLPDLAALGWSTVFEDDFDDGVIDDTVWHVDENNLFGLAREEAVEETGGDLVVRTYTQGGQHITGRVLSGDSAEPFPNGLSLTYGYIEAEVKLETKSGVRNAFWMMSPTNGTSPFGDPGGAGTEVDIFEHINPSSGGCVTANELLVGKHWDGVEEAHKSDVDNCGTANPSATALLGEYHKYGLLWDPSGYVIYVDGKRVYESSQARTYQPEHLRFTAEVVGGYAGAFPSGGYGGESTNLTLNNRMSVNYVKVMQRPVSDVAVQATAAHEPLAVPFTVADYRHQEPSATDTESITTAIVANNNATLFPAGSLSVAGDGPADPDGSLAKADFEATTLTPEWTLGGASRTAGAGRNGTAGLRLPASGARATQTLTGLRPSTTYLIDAWYDLRVGPTGADGLFDWGITDVDASRSGAQTVQDTHERLSWHTAPDGGPVPDEYRHDLLTFTTGPSTTSVEFFVSNDDYATNDDGTPSNLDSVVTIDDLTVTPVVPPERTLLATPAPGKSGTASIAVTVSRRSRSGAETVIGLEVIDINVAPGSATNLSFEAAGTAPVSWATAGPATVVDEQRAIADRSLQLGASSSASQTVTGLEANTWYRVSAAGSAETTSGDFKLKASGYDGTAGGQATLDSSNSYQNAVTFKTDASHTSAVLALEDTDGSDGDSYVKHVKLVECTSSTACPATSDVPAGSAPALSAVGPQQVASGGRLLVAWSGSTPTSVTSTNPDLVPPANVARATAGTRSALVVTPTLDRTGEATVTVNYSGGSKAIPVTVADAREANPGFEQGATGWGTLPSGASVQSTDKRSGTAALRVNDGTGQVVQVIGGLDYDTTYAFGAWVKGKVQLEVRDSAGNPLPGAGPTSVGGAGYAKGQVSFTTPADPDPLDKVTPTERAQVRLVIKDDTGVTSTASYVDDTFVFQGPTISPVREWSLRQGYPLLPFTDYAAEVNFNVGRIPTNAMFDPAVASITSGSTNLVIEPLWQQLAHPARPGTWRLRLSTPSTTFQGTVDVTVALTDPGTGITVQRVLPVDVNAGTSFDNGRFQKGAWPLVPASGTAGLQGVVDKRPSISPPWDMDRVQWVSDGKVHFQATGLTPGASYTVTASVIGTGGSVNVWTADESSPYGPGQAGTSTTAWVTKTVTFTALQTSVWVHIDDGAGDDPPVAGVDCTAPRPGESCWDDITLTKN